MLLCEWQTLRASRAYARRALVLRTEPRAIKGETRLGPSGFDP